jgi:DNA-directed RNA polymerase specialized sigma24 family protein
MNIKRLSDSLVVGMLSGDQKSAMDLREAIFQNCRRYFSVVYADDPTQETLITIWEQRSNPEMKKRPGLYATGINAHKIADAWRQRGKARRTIGLSIDDEDARKVEDTGIRNPEQIVIQREERISRKRKKDELLKDIYRIGDAAPGALQNGWKAFQRNYCGLSCAEIAEIMGAKEGTVKSWISRFRNEYLIPELEKRGWDIREATGFRMPR